MTLIMNYNCCTLNNFAHTCVEIINTCYGNYKFNWIRF